MATDSVLQVAEIAYTAQHVRDFKGETPQITTRYVYNDRHSNAPIVKELLTNSGTLSWRDHHASRIILFQEIIQTLLT